MLVCMCVYTKIFSPSAASVSFLWAYIRVISELFLLLAFILKFIFRFEGEDSYTSSTFYQVHPWL